MRHATILVAVLALTPFAHVTAQQASSLSMTHATDRLRIWTDGLVDQVRTGRPCLSAKPLPRCRSFLITEAHVRYRLSGPDPGAYVTAELGWMVNGRGKHSYGFSVFGGQDITWEVARGGLKGRYRRWLGKGMSLDLSAGVVLTSTGDGFLRSDKAGVTVGGGINFGALAVTVEFDYIPAEEYVPPETWRPWREGPDTPAIYVGAALGSKPGAVVMAAAASIAAMLAVMPDMWTGLGTW